MSAWRSIHGVPDHVRCQSGPQRHANASFVSDPSDTGQEYEKRAVQLTDNLSAMSEQQERAVPRRARRAARLAADAVLGRWLGSINAGMDQSGYALTFDDGPDPVVTPLLLDLLDELGVRSTFFLLVDQCDAHPELAREIAVRGHEIALHGRDHRRITSFPTARAAADYLKRARDDLARATGQELAFYRPPYGAQSLSTYRAAKSADLSVVVWNADVEDWVDRPAPDVAALGRTRIRPGGVMLFHERLEPDLPRAAPTTSFDRCWVVHELVNECRTRGLTPTTVGDLVRAGERRTAWFRS
jgi:peptidoglycan/xylan/chitin deacetylase (PgdA/CDA1 family)